MNSTHKTPRRGQPSPRGGPTGRLAVCAVAAALTALALVAPATAGRLEQVFAKGQDAKAAVKTKTAKKTVVAKRVVVNANRNLNPALVQQYVRQCRPTMHAELLFVRNVCRLERPALVKMYPECDKVLEDAATQFRGRLQVRAGEKDVDPETLLRQGLAAVFKKHLTADQYQIYEAETARREQARKKAAVGLLVDAVDCELLLSADQRATIRGAIEKNWRDDWIIYAEHLYHGNSFFPTDLDRHVAPALTEAQRDVWGATQKVRFRARFGNPRLNLDQPWVGELLGAPAVKRDVPAVKARPRPAVRIQTKVDDKPAAK